MSDTQNSAPVRGIPFASGHDARRNPGGRPKALVEVVRLAREHTVEAVEALVDIMRHSDKDQARVAAANAILDRGWGKAPTVPIDEEAQAKAAAAAVSPRDALAALLEQTTRGPDDADN